ncbi:hypothetical protein PUR23_16470 [Methylorubrum populi]|uniref:Uncharacterized protein with LGFP repeats n=1 Tax=Methylorubrum thiocyanatum TaxID=47958 RepID=A0AA40S2E3_9HYPH|nr:hypothetical protein [Methylorubrum thiocyanatum]MBA8913213.1 uncharacterized protein with LGFP repeats [Methylorubrum thiocyanatum]GJE80331.1 hypothetical protein CJNNKLLH_1665 [Methylorubrum thiocyanatum]
MARNAQTTTRPGDTRLEAAALLLAAFTALVAIARSDAAATVCAAPRAAARPAPAIGPIAAPPSAQETEAEAAQQATLRDMLLHD